MDTTLNLFSFGVFVLLWLAFWSMLLASPSKLDETWGSFRHVPLIVQILIALLILPVWLGLWIWEQRWPKWLRFFLVLAITWWNLFVFFPRFG
jgi:hypothetical protein